VRRRVKHDPVPRAVTWVIRRRERSPQATQLQIELQVGPPLRSLSEASTGGAVRRDRSRRDRLMAPDDRETGASMVGDLSVQTLPRQGGDEVRVVAGGAGRLRITGRRLDASAP
jgi:hypothetical protein